MNPKHLLIAGFIFIEALPLFGQDTTARIFTPLVDEVIGLDAPEADNQKVRITNLSDTKINEAPGSVYVITAEDIEKAGYRDLLEVFADIPGFNIATDVQNGTGISIRGAWAAEAKMLVMIDGLIMNDMAYGSFVIGGRIPLLNVERIEVIKGASSSIYGGIAGLGVINIITKSGNSSEGSSFLLDFGMSEQKISGTRVTFANTTYLLNNFELSLAGSVFTGNKSNRTIEHPDTTVTNFGDSSSVTDAYIQMRLKRENFEYKVLYDDYGFQATFEGINSQSRTFINDISYSQKFNKLFFSSFVNIKDQIPWNTQYGDPTVYDLQNLKTRRISVGSNLTYTLNDNVNFLLGGLYYNDYMRFFRTYLTLNNGLTSDNYNAFAVFGEASLKTKFVNIYAGGRLDSYRSFDPNFAPRLCLAKEFKFWHYKLIYGESFKIPTLQNINIAFVNTEPIRPEQITDYQVELGLRNKNHSLTAGAFYTNIDDVIVYGYDLTTFMESYVNNGHVTFGGLEATLKNKFEKFEITSTYSYYELLDSYGQDFVADTNNLKAGALGTPKHKITFRLTYEINEKNSITFYYNYLSKKYSAVRIDVTNDEYEIQEHPPTHLVDLVYRSTAVFKYFDMNVGVKNILGVNNYYLYPMNGGYPAGIGMGREFFIQLKVNL
jgi:outer membrane receptor for ferrienterochelin and colicin